MHRDNFTSDGKRAFGLAVHATGIMYTYLHLDYYSLWIFIMFLDSVCRPLILHIIEWPGYCYDLYLRTVAYPGTVLLYTGFPCFVLCLM